MSFPIIYIKEMNLLALKDGLLLSLLLAFFLWGGGEGWAILKKIPAQQHPLLKKKTVVQGEPWGKNRAIALYYPGPISHQNNHAQFKGEKKHCAPKTCPTSSPSTPFKEIMVHI